MQGSRDASIRRIVSTTAVLGSSSLATVLLSTVRLKVAALVLGVAGVGLVGFAQNFMVAGATLLGLGISQAAPGQIAKAAVRGPADEKLARKALVLSTGAAASFAFLVIWLARALVASRVFGDAQLTSTVGWLALGSALTIVGSSQTALLAGLGRIGDVARVAVIAGVASTVVGLGLLYDWGPRAVLPFILVVPLATCGAGALLTRRVPPVHRGGTPTLRLRDEARALTTVGISMTLAAAAANVAQLAVRAEINRSYGLPELGLFQAAWAISSVYLSMVLQAMAVDFFPRLNAAASANADEANQLVNDQTLIALLAAGPIILVALGLTPWALQLLYSTQFRQASDILRWQLFGDVLRIASWPLGYMLLATNARAAFLFVELTAQAVFVAATAVLLPHFGVEAAGMAFFCMYAIYLPASFIAVASSSRFRWTAQVASCFAATLLLCGTTFVIARTSETAGFAFALFSGAAMALLAARTIRRLMASSDARAGQPA